MSDKIRLFLLRILVPLFLGLALSLAFAPFEYWVIGWIVPAVLFWLWLQTQWRDAPLQGYFFGVGMFAGGVHWIYYSIYTYGGTPFEVAVILNGLLILFLALFPAVLAWGLKSLSRHQEQRLDQRVSLFMLAACFVAFWPLMEWLRGWLLTGFPWLSLGYSQIDGPLSGFAPVIGVYGVGMITVLVSVSLVLPILLGWTAQSEQSNRGRHALSVVFGIFVIVLARGLNTVNWSQPAGDAIRVAVLQGNIDQARKWSPAGRREALRRYLAMTEEQMDKDLIVWPETAVPYFFSDIAPRLNALAEEAKETGTAVLVGIPTREMDGRYFNSVIGLGNASGLYHKQHLVPFGEYVPLHDWIGPVLQFLRVPMSDFAEGSDDQGLISHPDWQIAVSICYESVFPRVVGSGVDLSNLLVNVTNDGWFGETIAPDQHLQIARMRALEFGRGMIRAASTGISAIIDEKGQLVGSVQQNELGILEGSVIPLTGQTPFSRYGDVWLFILLIVITVIWVLTDKFGRR